jgi:hypothetical protein
MERFPNENQFSQATISVEHERDWQLLGLCVNLNTRRLGEITPADDKESRERVTGFEKKE